MTTVVNPTWGSTVAAPLLNLVVPEATTACVPVLRRMTRDFTGLLGVPDGVAADVALCVTEVATNVVLHAYSGGAGPLRFTADHGEGALEVLVEDSGHGLGEPSPNGGLGLGLTLVARLSSRFDVAPRLDGGTAVWMRFEL